MAGRGLTYPDRRVQVGHSHLLRTLHSLDHLLLVLRERGGSGHPGQGPQRPQGVVSAGDGAKPAPPARPGAGMLPVPRGSSVCWHGAHGLTHLLRQERDELGADHVQPLRDLRLAAERQRPQGKRQNCPRPATGAPQAAPSPPPPPPQPQELLLSTKEQKRPGEGRKNQESCFLTPPTPKTRAQHPPPRPKRAPTSSLPGMWSPMQLPAPRVRPPQAPSALGAASCGTTTANCRSLAAGSPGEVLSSQLLLCCNT